MKENSGCCFVSCFSLMDLASLARGPGQWTSHLFRPGMLRKVVVCGAYMPGPRENPFPASHWCIAVLAWVTSVQSWRELCETSVEPTLFSETEFSLALLLYSPAPAQPQWFGQDLNTSPVLSCPIPAGPEACSSAWGWPGGGQPWTPSPAQPRLLCWGCRMGLVEEGGTALPWWPWALTLQPHSSSGVG